MVPSHLVLYISTWTVPMCAAADVAGIWHQMTWRRIEVYDATSFGAIPMGLKRAYLLLPPLPNPPRSQEQTERPFLPPSLLHLSPYLISQIPKDLPRIFCGNDSSRYGLPPPLILSKRIACF